MLCKFRTRPTSPIGSLLPGHVLGDGRRQQRRLRLLERQLLRPARPDGTVVKGWYDCPRPSPSGTRSAATGRSTPAPPRPTPTSTTRSSPASVTSPTRRTPGGPVRRLLGRHQRDDLSNLGSMDSEEDQQFNGILHESGHLFRLNHSRHLSQSPGQDDYGDQWDIVSCLGCFGTTTPSGGNGFRARPGCRTSCSSTPPAGSPRAARPSSSTRVVRRRARSQLAALNHPEATGFLDAKIPPRSSSRRSAHRRRPTTTRRAAREERLGRGHSAADAVLVHLHGQDDYSYLVDQSGLAGAGRYFHVAGPATGPPGTSTSTFRTRPSSPSTGWTPPPTPARSRSPRARSTSAE